jgi:uroporphyrinogen decarboxylase
MKDATSRERVMRALSGDAPDRVPLNVFAGWNPGLRRQVEDRFGSIANFEQRLNTDVRTGVLPRFPYGNPDLTELPDEIDDYLELDVLDPRAFPVAEMRCDGDLFLTVKEAVDASAGQKAVFAHAWGVFELSQFLFERAGRPGTEDALLNMIAAKDVCRELYHRLGNWTAACVDSAIDAGADAIELSDDWGQQNTMLFSPDLWWELVFPPTKIIVDRANERGVPVIIHSDGDISLVLDGVRELGVQGLHPVQESAGMDVDHVRSVLGTNVCLMGGLDTVSALPGLKPAEVGTEIGRVFDVLKDSGPFIFAGSHMFQDDTELAVIEAAYEKARSLGVY